MLHKPTQRKLPKKFNSAQKVHEQPQSKKPILSQIPSQRHPSIKGKVAKVEKKLDNVVSGLSQNNLQNMLFEEIKSIKSQLREIKEHIGIQGNGNNKHKTQNYGSLGHRQKKQETEQQEQEQEPEQEQNIYAIKNKSIHTKFEQHLEKQPKQMKNKSNLAQSRFQNERSRIGVQNTYKLIEKPKELVEVGKIQPYMKQFKIQVTKNLMPYYNGYHKKSSKPVIIKYCHETKSIESLFNLYEKLWKNIVKAKNICINKVYDLNEPLATYILVIDANKHSLNQLLTQRRIAIPELMCHLLRGIQFFHECGYLYRNVHPSHVMGSYQGQIVWLDLKNMKRFVDVKGKCMPVMNDGDGVEDEFVSNARARGLKQGRKDDLQSLGYLALYILEGGLPWGVNNLVNIRSKLTLKELCGKYQGLLQYMISIAQMQTDDVPDYNKLTISLSKI